MGNFLINQKIKKIKVFDSFDSGAHGFNAKIGFKNYALSPKILPKICQNLSRQTKPAYFQTFWLISWDSVHSF